jgi:hypothetical protein
VKVILDEMLPIGLRELLPAHDVVTAAYAGLAGIPNGELISRAIAAGFGVIVTLDLGILHQQNLAAQDIGFVLTPTTMSTGSAHTPSGWRRRSPRSRQVPSST